MKFLLYLILFSVGLISLTSCKEDLQISPTKYATVRGRVLYSSNQQPVQNAIVTLAPNNRVLTTDITGTFRFDSVLVASYTLQAEKTGYVTQVASVSATSADVLPVITLLLTAEKTPVTPVTPNTPPTSPVLVSPATGSTVQPNMLTLRWKSTDPDNNTLRYDVSIFKSSETTPVYSYTGLTVDTLAVPTLEYNTAYFWKVTVKDSVNTVNGPVWSFKTTVFPTYSYLFARSINGQYQIFGANATGDPVQLTRSGSNWRPTVSPDRQQIAFISNINTNLHLYIMNTDGSNIRQVTSVPVAGLYQTDLSFCWSPDGTQLVYPNNNRLLAVNTNGTGLRVVSQAVSGRVFAGCDWTPQGNQLVVRTVGSSVYDNEIATLQPDGSGFKPVYARTNKRVGNPAFSVTGRQVVFSADSSGFMNVQGRQLDARIYLLDLVTTGITDLSTFPSSTSQTTVNVNNKVAGTNDLDPRFSPNGAQLIFTNSDNSDSGTPAVYTITISGTTQDVRNRKQLFNSAEMPYWRQP